MNGEYAVYGATLLESEQDEQNRQLRRAAIIDDKNGEESEEEDDDEINDYSIESPKAPEKDSRRLFERLATPPSHLIFSQKVQLLRDFISDFEAIETQQERDEFASAILVSHRLLLDGCCEAAISSSDDEDRDLVLRYAEFVEIYYSQSDDSALIETREHEPALPSMELLDEIRSFTFKPKTAAVSSKSELPPEVLVSEEPVHTTDFGLSPSTLAKIAERLRHHSPMAAETTSSTAAAPIAESLKQLAEGVLGTTFTSPKDAFYALNSAQSLQHAQVDIKSLVKSTLTLIDKRYEENFDDEEETNKELAKAFGVEVGGQISIINMRELLKRLENPSVLDMHAELSASDIVHQTLEVSDAEQAHQETPVHTHEPEQLPLSMSVSPSMTALKAEAIDALTSLAKSFPNDQELTRYCQEKLSELDRQTSEEAIDSTHIKRIVSEANTLKEIMVAANLIISAFKSGPSALKRFLVPKALEIQTALDATPAEDRLKLVRFTGNYVHSKGKKTAIDEFLEKLAAPFIGKEEKLVKNAFDTFKGKMLQLSSGVKQGANESQAASARSENSKDAGRK